MFAAEQPAAEPGPVRKLSDVRVDFSAVFDALPTAYLVLTRELHIAAANMAYQRLVGLSAADMAGHPGFEVFPPTPASLSADGANTVRALFERARDTGRIDVMPLVNYDILNPATGHVEERHWAHDRRACARP